MVEQAPLPEEGKMVYAGLVSSLDKLGLLGIQDIGMSGARLGDMYRYKTYIGTENAETVLFRMLGKDPHQSAALPYAPGDSALFHTMDFDLPTLLSYVNSLAQSDPPLVPQKNLDQLFQKFRDEFGIQLQDIVSSLGTEIALIVRMDMSQTIVLPDQIVIHPFHFALLIPTKQNILHETTALYMEKNNIPFDKKENEQIKRISITLPPNQYLPFSPELVFNGEYEILVSDPSLTDKILQTKANKLPGLAQAEEFKNLFKDLPDKYNGLTFFSDKLSREILDVISKSLDKGETKGEINTRELSDFLKIFLGARISVRVNEPQGIRIVTHQIVGSDSGNFPALMGAPIAYLKSGNIATGLLILPAIAIPNFLEAQTRSKVSKTKADIRYLSCGLEAYRVDHGSYPKPSETGFMQAPTVLTTPIGYVRSIPEDPFAPEKGGKVRYYLKDNKYLLYTAGPDRFFDIDPEKDFDPQKIHELSAKTYDPTNGTVSSGDIIQTNIVE